MCCYMLHKFLIVDLMPFGEMSVDEMTVDKMSVCQKTISFQLKVLDHLCKCGVAVTVSGCVVICHKSFK
jgi:hypothetical protein